jgi:hypothetical protein
MSGCGCNSCSSPSSGVSSASTSSSQNAATPSASPQAGSSTDSNKADAASSKDGGSPQCSAKPTCHHPLNGTCSLMNQNLDFGLRVGVTWQSPTGNLADLSACHVTELITYSQIPNPPFARPDGSTPTESGQTQRIPADPGLPASSGRGQDTHRHPRSFIRTPLVGGSYHVDQSYEYNCSICGCGWVSFVRYVITYKLYQDENTKEWRFLTLKTGPGGPFQSDEKY